MKINIFSTGKTKETWLQEALLEYEARLKGRVQLEWKIFKDDAALEKALTGISFMALDEAGSLLSSHEFSALLFREPRLNFLIGGPAGLTPLMRQTAKATISLSRLTFTHQIVRLILIEQIYRGLEIERGSPYQK